MLTQTWHCGVKDFVSGPTGRPLQLAQTAKESLPEKFGAWQLSWLTQTPETTPHHNGAITPSTSGSIAGVLQAPVPQDMGLQKELTLHEHSSERSSDAVRTRGGVWTCMMRHIRALDASPLTQSQRREGGATARRKTRQRHAGSSVWSVGRFASSSGCNVMALSVADLGVKLL
jgi:hypothetical protein